MSLPPDCIRATGLPAQPLTLALSQGERECAAAYDGNPLSSGWRRPNTRKRASSASGSGLLIR